jgi:membrane protein required for colicin V production
MNLLDICILIVVALTTIRGFFKGFIQEATTILGLIASFFLASLYYKRIALWVSRFFPHHEVLLEIFSFLSIFFLCMVLFHLLAKIIRGVIRMVLLGWLDRGLGGLFGLVKGTVIIFFLVTLLMLFYPKSSPVVKDSRFFPSILTFTEKLTFLIPEKIKDDFFQKKKELQDVWEGRKRSDRKKSK